MNLNSVKPYSPVVDTNLNAGSAADDPKKATDTQQPEQGHTAEVSRENVEHAVKVANEIMQKSDTRFEYSFDKSINREIVKVVDRETGEVIRQLPPPEIVNMVTRMYDMLGILVDKKI